MDFSRPKEKIIHSTAKLTMNIKVAIIFHTNNRQTFVASLFWKVTKHISRILIEILISASNNLSKFIHHSFTEQNINLPNSRMHFLQNCLNQLNNTTK